MASQQLPGALVAARRGGGGLAAREEASHPGGRGFGPAAHGSNQNKRVKRLA